MKKHLITPLLVLGFTQSSLASEISDWVRFSGFGTVGVVHSSDDEADYRSNIEQSTGVGKSNNYDSGVDTIFGAQMDMQLHSKVSATAQLVSRRMSSYDSTRPYFEWANIKYQPTEQTYLRVGRMVNPTFLVSESRFVGYAQPAIRPVAEVYLLSPISYMNGVDGGYKFNAGPAFVKLRAGMGVLDQQINQINGTLDFKFDIKTVDATIEYEGSVFRFGYQRVNMDVKNDALELYDVAMNQLEANNVANASAIHDRMQRLDVPIDFYNIGYTFDEGTWFVQSEYTIRDMHSDFAQSLEGFYFLAGYHWNSLSPYLTYSQFKTRNLAKFPALDVSSIDPALGGLVSAVNGGSERNIERNTWSLGVRWDVMSRVAVKAQFDHIMKPKNTVAEFVNTSDAFFAEQRDINLFAVALDFTF